MRPETRSCATKAASFAFSVNYASSAERRCGTILSLLDFRSRIDREKFSRTRCALPDGSKSRVRNRHGLVARSPVRRVQPAHNEDNHCSPRRKVDLSMAKYLFTSESVSMGHPDKVSDQVSD